MEWLPAFKMPTERQWRAWLAPISTEVYIEFMCNDCGARCKTFNQFAAYVEGAEIMGKASCTLFAKVCQAQNMEEPMPLSLAKIESAQIVPRILRYSPLPSLQDEGMVTARGPPEETNRVETISVPSEEANTEDQHSKIVRRRRRVRGTRFVPIMRPVQRLRKRAVTRITTSTT